MFKKVLVLLLSTAFFIGLQQLIELKTLGFCLQKIKADDLLYQQSWETTPLSHERNREIDNLLDQSYHLIGAGSECFAFRSEDGKAVIKFFKFDHTRPVYFKRGLFSEDHSGYAGTLSNHPLTRMVLPAPLDHYLRRLLGIREFRIQRTFSSVKLAYEELKEETGLLYLHLNPTDHFHRMLTLYDRNGIRHEIDLDSTRFFLQKRAVPIQHHFSNLRKNGKHREASESIDSLLNLILSRCKKGFADRDFFNKNLGFIDNQAIEIDTGSFHKNLHMRESRMYKRELFFATLELKSWLKKNYPEMVSHLEEKVFQEIAR
ncbi:MAG: hypothetical protein WA347_07780 [Rhabdochlamydiaceae bacterium]